MAKKNKEVVEESISEEIVTEEVDNTADEALEKVAEVLVDNGSAQEELVEEKQDIQLKANDSVEIVDFYVRSYNGLKATVKEVSKEEVLIELADGTQAAFKTSNLRKI